jgi:uncharacterized DUF497 family protein
MVLDETFDSGKSPRTKLTRGIDFIEARAVWLDIDAIEGPADIRSLEVRWLKIGRIKEKIWTVGFTYRESGFRIFKVRPARKDEKDVYNGY